MSNCRKESIKCPHCGEEGTFTLWESVNVDLDPSLREKVLNEDLFIWECPKCGQKTFIPFGTLYHDMKHQFMIAYQFGEPENDVNRDGVDMPDQFGMSKDYVYRSVYGLMNLKEKVLILENGLNDVVIERLKYALLHILNTGLEGCELFFLGVYPDDKENSEYGSIGFLVHKEGEEDRSFGMPMDTYYEQKLAVELDSRMRVTDWVCVDEKWMFNHLKP